MAPAAAEKQGSGMDSNANGRTLPDTANRHRIERAGKGETIVSTITRVIGVFLIAVAVVVAVHAVVEPLYYASTESSPDSPAWGYINVFAALSVVLGVIFGYLRKRASDAAGGAEVSWGRIAANVLFYGFVFVGVIFLWNWFGAISDRQFSVAGDGTIWLMWRLVFSTLPLLSGALGVALLRGGSNGPAASQEMPRNEGEKPAVDMLKRGIGAYLIIAAVAVGGYFMTEPLHWASTEAAPYSPIWDVALDPLTAAAILLGLVFATIGKRAVDREGGDAAVTWERLSANALFYGFLFVGMLFYWDWFSGAGWNWFRGGDDAGYTAGGDVTFITIWVVTYAAFTVLAGTMGVALLRGSRGRG